MTTDENRETPMQSEIVSSKKRFRPHPDPAEGLDDRLDAAIGETSSGVGALMSELIRRSLRTGVSDIGNSLSEFVEEEVETAVGNQMPLISEAADAVAESTSKRVVMQSVVELKEISARQQVENEAKIKAAETGAIDRSRAHTDEAVGEVRKSIDETRTLADETRDESDQKILALREKAKLSWRKIKDEIETMNAIQQQLRSENQFLRQSLKEMQSQAETQNESHTQLRSQHQGLHSQHQQLLSQHQELHSQHQDVKAQLEERLDLLEQPKGIRALWSKVRGGGKGKPEPEKLGETESDLSAPSDSDEATAHQ